jgi:DNA invertase Pin-like site-specific DNA recombinase
VSFSRVNAKVKRSQDGLVVAAEYVRMSTDHQRYSTENQSAAIHDYAARNGMTIVRTYKDEGKSGLDIEGRQALSRLIDDVQHGRADFSVILVYDISRWGRFQDADQAAYYEYRCTQAGIRVIYCAEPFENDGSPLAAIIKSVKRSMAGEYSRELSVKVFTGQCRLVQLGFHQGGAAGFGLRRALISEKREFKATLGIGEHKSIQTDRVILVPGPEHEIELVQRIYRDFVEHGLSEKDIAAQLNAEGISTDLNRPWTRGTVHQVLTNEKYIGNNVYNRTSAKLKQPSVRNAPELWVRCDGAFHGIVSARLMERVHEILLRRSMRFESAQMLELLRTLLNRAGSLSGLIIDEQEDMPSSTAYRSRFGGLLRAYQLIGYTPDRDYRYLEVNRALRAWHPQVCADIVDRLRSVGAHVRTDPQSDLLVVNGEWTASVVIARSHSTSAGSLRWKMCFEVGLAPDVTVAVRMDRANLQVHDYYLVPSIDMAAWPRRISEENAGLIDSYRYETLNVLEELAARSELKEVA